MNDIHQQHPDTDDGIEELKEINYYMGILTAIKRALHRDSMKVVFVGHTSNGKSTIINS